MTTPAPTTKPLNGHRKKPAPVLDIKPFTNDSEVVDPVRPQLQDFEHLRITTEKDYPNHEPLITWNGGGIAAPGNITGISAAAKAGKTAFTSVLLAGAISTGEQVEGFENIEVKPNIFHKAVVGIDTEQSEVDHQYNFKTILKRAGILTTPDYALMYNYRKLTVEEFQKTTDGICEAAQSKYNGIHLIVIDGGADFITSVNDEEQAYKIVEYFTHLAIKYECPVIIVLHLNPGTDKERGHFGSHIQRKCYGLVSIKKDGDVSIAESKIMRKAGVGELEPVYYKYNSSVGYHTEIAAPQSSSQSEKQLEKIRSTSLIALPAPGAYQHNEAVRKIMVEAKQTSDRTAKDWLKAMVAHGWVSKGEDGLYRSNLRTGVIRGNSG